MHDADCTVQVLAQECPTVAQQEWIVSKHEEPHEDDPSSDDDGCVQRQQSASDMLRKCNAVLRQRNHASYVEQVAWMPASLVDPARTPPSPATGTNHAPDVAYVFHLTIFG